MSEGYFPDRSKESLDDLFSGLITANHILHSVKVLDGYGHVSVRNPDYGTTFFTSHNVSPALVSEKGDLVEFEIEDGSPTEPDDKIGWSERYGHSEVYKRFPDVNCIIHSHSSDVLPYGVGNVSLKPLIHMASFLGTSVPVWDIQSAYNTGFVPSFNTSSEHHDLLIRTNQLGISLASAFTTTSTVAGSVYTSISSRLTGSKTDPPTLPDHPVVLMRGHGMTIAAKSIEEAVYMAYYTQEAARVQTAALMMSSSHSTFQEGSLEGTVDVAGENPSGKISKGKITRTGPGAGDLKYLSAKEAKDSWEVNAGSVSRLWKVWKRIVEVDPVYVNAYVKK